MKIRCIIVDDEPPARDELAYLLGAHGDIEIVGQAGSASAAIEAIRTTRPDLVFLDIQMPGKNGFQVVEALSQMENPPLFIFATAYDQYAVQAFEASAVDYIMKPFDPARLSKSLDRVKSRLGEQPEQELKQLLETVWVKKQILKLSVENRGRLLLVDPDDIVFCRYEDKKILVHTRDRSYPLYGISTMDKLEKTLEGLTFFRTHRVSMVNLSQVKEFSPWFNGKYNLTMKDRDQTEIMVSRSRVKDFKSRFGI